ncbi:MAG TPA: sulfite reductase [NADPH] flavoprotein alpha-component, partial [Candidatus Angelobacter sp.]|nr:sulfite reductase [NADPH] flavoprotein alpha-component [Candidatus Angelobacter sp.]
LFFGDQHFSSDFLYQVDWQRWLKEGVLTRIDVAFSRDEAEKVYVQHRMLEKSRDLFQWLQEGAALYICGDEKNMAKDVHDTVVVILQKEGQMSESEAEAYLSELKKEKRYQRDVY